MKKLISPLRKFNSFRLLALFIFISVLFCGCISITPAVYRLDPVTVERVGEVNAEVCVENENISIKVLSSGYGSGLGLVGALMDSGVDSKRKKDAERIIVPLREKTTDIKFCDDLRNALLPMLKELSWPQVIEVKTQTKSIPITLSEVQERSLLDINTTYQLSTTAEVLDISTGFALYLKGSTKASVVGGAHYSSKRIGKYEENENAIALWAANDAAAYHEALNLGIEETVKMLRLALPYAGGKSPIRPLNEMVKLKVRIAHGRGDYGIKLLSSTISGWIMEESEDRIIFQVEPGGFLSFPKSDILERLIL